MKLIDRYLLRTFLVPLAYCLAAFSLLYVVYDLFDNLSEFITAKTSLFSILRYYVFLMPSVIIYIVPISLLLAVLYALSQLTRHNELTAMRASGLSLYRLMVPFIAMGFLASIVVGIIDESFGSWSAYWTEQFISAQKNKGEISVYLAENLAYKNEQQHRIWFVGSFDTRDNSLRHIEITQQREDSSDLYKIQAAKAEWLDGHWWLTDSTCQHYDNGGHPLGELEVAKRLEMTELTETPQNFLNEIKEPRFLSAFELRGYLRTHQHISKQAKTRFQVDFQQRLAMPWTCLIVTLLGVPFGSHTGRKGAMIGVVLSLGLFFSFYVLSNVGLALGKKELLSPWLAAWAPNIIYFAIGATLVYRLK